MRLSINYTAIVIALLLLPSCSDDEEPPIPYEPPLLYDGLRIDVIVRGGLGQCGCGGIRAWSREIGQKERVTILNDSVARLLFTSPNEKLWNRRHAELIKTEGDFDTFQRWLSDMLYVGSDSVELTVRYIHGGMAPGASDGWIVDFFPVAEEVILDNVPIIKLEDWLTSKPAYYTDSLSCDLNITHLIWVAAVSIVGGRVVVEDVVGTE